MKTFADALEAAEKVSKYVEKHQALVGIHHSQTRLIHEALNKYRRFNVKKWDKPTKYAEEDPVLFTEFYLLLDALHDRTVTGNDARDAVTRVLSHFTKRTAKYLARVIKKDLDCGAESKTFRKIYPEVDIPGFKVMLAKKIDSKYKWKFPSIAEVKYDGQRLIAFVDPFVGPDEVTIIYTARSGRPADFCQELLDRELLQMAHAVGQSIVVDGEVLGDNFQDSMKAKGSKNQDKKDKLNFYVFDMMTGHEWTTKKCKKIQAERSLDLTNLVRSLKLKRVVKSEARIIESMKDAQKFYEHVLSEGGEGLIVKDPEAFYTWDRSESWKKWKQTYNVDLKIVAIYLGKGKFANIMGTVDCVGKDENGNRIEVAVGGGYSDEDRDYFLRNRELLIGKTMEIEHYGLMKADKSDVWSLRHPQFIKIRDDK